MPRGMRHANRNDLLPIVRRFGFEEIRPEELPPPVYPGETYQSENIPGAQAPIPQPDNQSLVDILGAILGRRN